jgi:hypothetical protein
MNGADLWEIFFVGAITGAGITATIFYPLIARLVGKLEEEAANRKFWQGRHKRGYQERVNGRLQ